MDGDGLTIFNPSTFQNLAEVDDANDDEEDQHHIEQQIEERLADMDGEDLNLEDDDDDDSIVGRNIHQTDFQLNPTQFQTNLGHVQNHLDQNFHTTQNQSHPTAPFSFGIGITSGSSEAKSGQIHLDERRFLLDGKDQKANNLEILYQARGEEIKRLKSELGSINDAKTSEMRQILHEVALLKAENGRLKANLDHYQSVAQGQSDENRELRRELTNIETKLNSADETKRNLVSQLESSELMVKTLQQQLSDLQKSETILKAKQHHEQVVRSLKERHETEMYNMQQENDRLNLKLKHLENEVDSARSKCSKAQRDHEIMMIEKSDRVKELHDQVEMLQKRLAQTVADTSSQAYVGIKAMHEKFKQDQEKYATDLLAYQDEISQLKGSLKRKDDELTTLQQAVSKFKQDQDLLLTQKSEIISSLQQRLDETEKRFNRITGERNQLAMTTESNEKLRNDLRKAVSELEKAHLEIHDIETEVASLSSKLQESQEKYATLKNKVRQYQVHCKSKETKFVEKISEIEEEYKQKLRTLRDRVEEGYSLKEKQVEQEVLSLKHHFDQELQKILKIGSSNPDQVHLGHLSPDQRSSDEENSSQRPVIPQPGTTTSTPTLLRPLSASEELSKILENAKLELRDSLKRPQERLPLSSLTRN